MRPLQFTGNTFPTLSHYAVSIPAFGPWRSYSVDTLLCLVNLDVFGKEYALINSFRFVATSVDDDRRYYDAIVLDALVMHKRTAP